MINGVIKLLYTNGLWATSEKATFWFEYSQPGDLKTVNSIMAIVGPILACIRSKNWATFKNWDLKGGQCGSKIALVIFIYYIIKRGVGVRAHWALEYGYVTPKGEHWWSIISYYMLGNHFSTLSVSRQVCKVSIDLLTLAGLSADISADRPANPRRCMVSLQTC